MKDGFTVKTENNTIERIEATLRESISGVPFVELDQTQREPDTSGSQTDLKAWLDLPDGEWILLLQFKSSGQPRIVRNAMPQIRRQVRQFPRAYGVFVAPYISPASAKVLAENNMGYLDLAGNCLLNFGTVYISKEGKTNPFTEKRDLRSLYAPKAARVIRVLLSNPTRIWRTKALADEAGVSLGQVANVKKLLEDREWLSKEREGLKLVKPEALLTEWVGEYSYRKNEIRQYYSLKTPSDFEADLTEVCLKENICYALTGFSGAARLAPFVRYQRAMAYVADERDQLAELLDLKEVDSGANVWLMTPYDEGVFYGSSKVDSACVAALVQVYLDLQGLRGRGEEAAEYLLREVIKKEWC